MGQQQLLLLVLSTVIVGLAVVVGIEAFSQNRDQANVDALVNQGVSFASDAQAWAMKPAAFGGPDGGGDDNWSSFTWDDIGVDTQNDGTSDSNYDTEQGTWSIGSKSDGSLKLVGTNSSLTNCVSVTVTGPNEDQITTNTDPSSASGC